MLAFMNMEWGNMRMETNNGMIFGSLLVDGREENRQYIQGRKKLPLISINRGTIMEIDYILKDL